MVIFSLNRFFSNEFRRLKSRFPNADSVVLSDQNGNFRNRKKFVAIDFHYSVDLCELIGNPNEKYRRIRKDTDTSKNVRAALAVLGNVVFWFFGSLAPLVPKIHHSTKNFDPKIHFWPIYMTSMASYCCPD